MRIFKNDDRVIFHESESGLEIHATVLEVLPADDRHPKGGLYIIELDSDGSEPEVFWTELTLERP